MTPAEHSRVRAPDQDRRKQPAPQIAPPSRRARDVRPEATERAEAPIQAPRWHYRDPEPSAAESTDDAVVAIQDEEEVPGGDVAQAQTPPIATAATASLTLSNDKYVDTAASSKKNIKFNVKWKDGAKEDYVIVNWLKGSIKDPKGKPYKVRMYGSLVDFDFGAWQVDSVDADPVYWSAGGVRWKYNVDGADAFHATDSPGPPSFAKGTKADVEFKTGVYKDADVPSTTKGSLSATPFGSLEPWTYKMEALGGGKYSH